MKKYIEAEQIQLVFSGNDYFDKLEQMIEQCHDTFHLQTYIFDSDATGLRIISALKKAALRGVKISILLDAFGSYSFSNEVKKEIESAGIRFRFFSPLFSHESLYFGRRLHYKIAVADKNTAMTGGINIADKYSGQTGHTPWLDYAVLIKGNVCEYLHLLCEQMDRKQKQGSLQMWEKLQQAGDTNQHNKLVRFRLNDWINQLDEIHLSYVEKLTRAKKSIIIVASYFLPGRTFQKLLASAASRGVDIKILLTGKSDVSSAKFAENYLYDFFLRNKIRLYEWNSSVMHAKVMIIDDSWVTLGSYNLNFLSHYICVELNADIADKAFATEFASHLDEIFEKHSTFIDLQNHEMKKSWFGKIKMWSFYTFFRLLMSASVSRKKLKKEKQT